MGEREITIFGAYITLAQLLKKESFIGSGGECRDFLASHLVQVNGERETRRGRKLYAGDIVLVSEQRLLIRSTQ